MVRRADGCATTLSTVFEHGVAVFDSARWCAQDRCSEWASGVGAAAAATSAATAVVITEQLTDGGSSGGGQAGLQLTDVETERGMRSDALTGEWEACTARAGGVWRCK